MEVRGDCSCVDTCRLCVSDVVSPRKRHGHCIEDSVCESVRVECSLMREIEADKPMLGQCDLVLPRSRGTRRPGRASSRWSCARASPASSTTSPTTASRPLSSLPFLDPFSSGPPFRPSKTDWELRRLIQHSAGHVSMGAGCVSMDLKLYACHKLFIDVLPIA